MSGPGTPRPDGPGTPRPDGFAAIEDYAALGDGRTAALIAGDGRIDWWPIPRLDSPPICAALVDPEDGGYLLLAPGEPFGTARRYVPGTNVLETTFTTAAGSVRVLAALNVGAAGRLPWTELVQRVEGVAGAVRMRCEFRPGDRFGQANPWVSDHHGTPVVTVADQTLAVVSGGFQLAADGPRAVKGEATVAAGERAVLAVVATDGEPLFVPDAAAADQRLDRTVASWRTWSSLLNVDGRFADAVRRSALALKVLISEATGAIAAAATTSLPEGVGGAKNWDYRFSWVRDSSFVLDALINLGLHEEVHGAVSWLLDTIGRQGLGVFYDLDGEIPTDEAEVAAPGYQGSRPVRDGNAAADQLQLGTYGDLLDTVARYVDEGHVLDAGTARLLVDLAGECCDRWRRPDSGIWELDDQQHYTISKIGCWVALDRAIRLADAGHLSARSASRWRVEREELRAWIDRHCWSPAKQAYTLHAGTDRLDAAVLLAGRTGFDRSERLSTTADAVRDELGRGPLLYRYSGVEDEEGAFVACSFWLVEALALVGRVDEAEGLMGRLVERANDVALLAEQIDPKSGVSLGNVPQALSHLALVNAAFILERARAGPRNG